MVAKGKVAQPGHLGETRLLDLIGHFTDHQGQEPHDEPGVFTASLAQSRWSSGKPPSASTQSLPL